MNGDNVDPTAMTKMGDSASCTSSITRTFTIPADKVDAVALVLDTTVLADGDHTLSVSSDSEQKDIIFSVLNSVAPQPKAQTVDVNVDMHLSHGSSVASVKTGSDVSTVTIYKARSLSRVSIRKGAGDSTALVDSRCGNQSSVSKNGDYPYQLLNFR